MSARPSIEADLRRAMLQAGRSEREIAGVLEALSPVVAAVERASTKVDADVAWALLAVAADHRRRRAQVSQGRRR